MSFKATCDRCNYKEVFELPHAQSLAAAQGKGWLIEPGKILCPQCHRGTKSMDLVTGTNEMPDPKQDQIVQQIKDQIVLTVRQFAKAHPHINSPLVNLAKQLEMAEMSVEQIKQQSVCKKGKTNWIENYPDDDFAGETNEENKDK